MQMHHRPMLGDDVVAAVDDDGWGCWAAGCALACGAICGGWGRDSGLDDGFYFVVDIGRWRFFHKDSLLLKNA